MLELNKSSKKRGDSFRDQVGKVLGEKTGVKARKQQIVIECKDLDEIASRKDICVALRDQQFNLSAIEESLIKTIKKAY